jgi:hypothetical protein
MNRGRRRHLAVANAATRIPEVYIQSFDGEPTSAGNIRFLCPQLRPNPLPHALCWKMDCLSTACSVQFQAVSRAHPIGASRHPFVCDLNPVYLNRSGPHIMELSWKHSPARGDC